MARATIGGFAGFSPSAVLTLSAYATEMARSSVLAVEGEVAARLGRVSEAEDAFARARAITSDDSLPFAPRLCATQSGVKYFTDIW
jgi:hypothetical protein